MILLHFGVHGAGVDGAGRLGRGVLGCSRYKVLQWVRCELALALGATEIVGPPFVRQFVFRLLRNGHAAHRIL
ncbi:hypothetical protein AM305_09286 [Actinobacillus minor NM305]|uniref:Uncharacterized protein n=1 Tax=Actinobacillus minor NM305 TaxID=637911 RepID=C5S1W0_9PAST|nr:hypothetical protein AM305_09286 [Actinobacillus minor NM305]